MPDSTARHLDARDVLREAGLSANLVEQLLHVKPGKTGYVTVVKPNGQVVRMSAVPMVRVGGKLVDAPPAEEPPKKREPAA